MVRRQPFFYGWVIVGIAIITMALVYGIRHSFSVFFPPILEEFGWSRGNTTIMLSLNLLFYGLLAPVAGSLGDRWKPKRVIITGIIIVGLATAGCAFVSELWHFYLLFGLVMPIGSALSAWPLMIPAISNWFVSRRGLVIAMGGMGAGLSFVYGSFAELIISWVGGWRPAFFVMAGILVTLLLPLYLFFFQYHPRNKVLKAYGAAELPAIEESAARLANPAPNARDWTLGQAMKTYQLWLLAFSWLLFWGIACYLVLAHQVKFAEDMGYSSGFAASVFGLFGISMVAGQFSSSISDWIGRERTVTLAVLLTIGGTIALLSVRDTSQPWLLYLYAIPFGLGAGLYPPAIAASAADMFYGKNFGGISGFLLTGMGLGGAIGPWLGGYIHDVSGSYTSALILCIACWVISCVSVWIAAPRRGFLQVKTQQ